MSYTETDSPLVGMPALEQAFLEYRDQGLRLPPVPHELVATLEERGEGTYTTEPMNLSDRAATIDLALDPDTPSQVGFGQVGHGVSSWFFCTRLITQSVAVFVRASYGGIYSDNAANVTVINAILLQIEELVVAADTATARGRLAKGKRMLVVLDENAGSYWQAGAGQAATASDDPVEAALAWIAA